MIKKLSAIKPVVITKKASKSFQRNESLSKHFSNEDSDDDESDDEESDDENFAGSSVEKFNSILFKMMMRSQKRAPITLDSVTTLLSRAGISTRNCLFMPWLRKSNSIALDVCSARLYRSLLYKDRGLAALAAELSEDLKREMKVLDKKYRKRAGDPAGDIAHQIRMAHEDSKSRFASKPKNPEITERKMKVRPMEVVPGPPGVSEKPWYGQLSSKGNEAFYDYEGEWKDGLMEGLGNFYFADGGEYVGSWSKGKANGFGKATYPTGEIYEGHWKDGRYHGEGNLKYSTGVKYEGFFQKGKRHGKGKMTYPNGRCYEGMFQSGVRHGRGKEETKSGFDGRPFAFEGNWKVNSIDGPGTVTKVSGEKDVRALWQAGSLNDLVQILEAEEMYAFEMKEEARQQLLGPVFNINLERFVDQTRKAIKKEREEIKHQEKVAKKKAAQDKKEAARKLKDEFRNQVINEWADKAPS